MIADISALITWPCHFGLMAREHTIAGEQVEKQNCSKLQQKAKEQREKGQGLSYEQ